MTGDAAGGTISVFDLDGVLSRSDTMAAVVLARLRRRPWVAVPVALLTLTALLAGPSSGLRPRCNRAVVHIALRGLSADGYRRMADGVARRLASRPGNAPGAIVDALRRCRREGDVVVVTASEHSLASSYLSGIGFADVPVVGSTFVFGASGPRFADHNVGPRKVQTLREQRPGRDVALLYTDSASDLPLASISARTVLVAPSPWSLHRFRVSGTDVELLRRP